MKVNLKKAAALSAAVSAVAVRYDHQYNVDLYADPPTQESADKSRELLAQQISTGLALVESAFAIRLLIGKANEGRINALLTARALTEKKLAVVNSVPLRRQGTNIEALKRQIEAHRAQPEQRVYGRAGLTLDLETEGLLTPTIRSLRKQKRELDDELQMLNYNTQIELPENVVKVLTDLDLV